MSASVATHMVGLPNFDYSSDSMPEFTATQFPHHMGLDRSTEVDDNHNNHDHNLSETQSQTQAQAQASNHVSDNNLNTKDQSEALGNLLGALIPNQTEQGGDLTNFSVLDNGFPNGQDLFATDDQVPAIDPANYDLSRLPSFDATAGANELFSNTDFSQLDPVAMNIPHTPNGQHMPNMDPSQYRRDSYTSQTSIRRSAPVQQRQHVEAFARLQFEDGNFYMTTHQCELGRDVLAYKVALRKEKEEKEARRHKRSKSSSGFSHPSRRVRRQIGSQVQQSVVSEAGGFAGIDEAAIQAPQNPAQPHMSSQGSESSVVKPAEYFLNPRAISIDYNRIVEMQNLQHIADENTAEGVDDEEPAAVTAEHMPNPHLCPLLPIHGSVEGKTDTEAHRSISRRHVKLYWSFIQDQWLMEVKGTNGAYTNRVFHRRGQIVPLYDGSEIQIAHIRFIFRLPINTETHKTESKSADQTLSSEDLEELDADEALPSVEPQVTDFATDDGLRESPVEARSAPKINLKITQKIEQPPMGLPLGPDGLPIQKRRGPGRPPKDGIMSTRERKEREKAAKVAAARQANGGKTPPASARPKISKPSPPAIEEVKTEAKSLKRKYTKRKSLDENGNPIFNADGDDEEGEAVSDSEPKSKKQRAQREKSESPEYPSRESLTAEQLQRPTESYAQLLYKLLMDLYPRALPLKEIYRELKMRYPWFVHEATTEGWQSSVRHNLNSEFGKLFDKGDKEGKGFAWRAMPNAQLPQTEKKRTVQPPVQRARAPQPRAQFTPMPGQNLQWQGTGPFPTNGQQPFINSSPWPQQGQPNGNWPPNVPPSQRAFPQPNVNGVNGTSQQSVAQQNTPTSVQVGYQTGSAGPPVIPRTSQPPSSTPQPPPAAAASNMPCTLAGVEAIQRFQGEMMNQLRIHTMSQEKQEFWQGVFASAKKQALHGQEGSSHKQGDSREEATILWHMMKFVRAFANPDFKGFTRRTAQPEGSERAPSQTPTAASAPVPAQSTSSSATESAVAPIAPTASIVPAIPVAAPAAVSETGSSGSQIAPAESAQNIASTSQPAQTVDNTLSPNAADVTSTLPNVAEQTLPNATQ